MCKLISYSGFRLIALRPRGFFIFTVSVRVFDIKNSCASLFLPFIFNILFELPKTDRIDYTYHLVG